MPSFGRGVHPRLRPSSLIHWPLDDNTLSAALDFAAVGGTVRSLGTYASFPEPAMIRTPIGGLGRSFVEGVAAYEDNILTAAGDVTVRDVLVGDFTFSTWFRIPFFPTGSRWIYIYGTYPTDGDAANNILFAVLMRANGGLSVFWESGTGTNHAIDWIPPEGIPRGEWLNFTTVKSDTTGENGTTTVTFFLNGAQVFQQTGVTNTAGGQNSNHYVGAERENAGGTTAKNHFTGDIAGMYFWDEVLTVEQIEDDFRRGQALPFYNRTDFRLEIAAQDGTTIDLTDHENVDWVDEVEIDNGADEPTISGTATLFREIGDLSLAYLRTDSKLNLADKFDPTSWDPLIDIGRRIELRAATVPLGLVADEGELSSVLRGKIKSVDWSSGKVVIEWRDDGDELITAISEQEINYSEPAPDQDPPGAGPFAVETEMQQMLNDNDNDNTNDSSSAFPNDTPPLTVTTRTGSYEPITLYVSSSGLVPVAAGIDPTIVGWAVLIWRQRREPVLSGLRNLSGQIGWECRYRWSETHQDWLLQFYEPQRDRSFPSIILDPNELQSVTTLKIDAERIRNVVRVPYSSSEDTLPVPAALSTFNVVGTDDRSWAGRDGKNDRMRAFYVVELTASVARYGRRFMEVAEASSSQIDTIFETQRYAVGIVKDLSEPELDKAIELPLMWEIDLQDVVQFRPARELYTGTQQLAVQKLTHTFGDAAMTSLKLAGKPRVGYKRWLTLESRPGVSRPGVLAGADALTDQVQGSVLAAIKSLMNRTDLFSGGKYLNVRNNEFQSWNDGVQNPPDSWKMTGGVFGTDVVRESTTTRSGGSAVEVFGPSGEITSDIIPILGGVNTPYSFELDFNRVSPLANPTLDVQWYQGDRTTLISTTSLTPGGAAPNFPAVALGAGFWSSSRVDGIHPPAGTKFIRLVVKGPFLGGSFVVDKVTAYRTSRASRAGVATATSWGDFIPSAGTGENIPLTDVAFASGFYDRGNNLVVDETNGGNGHHFLCREPGSYELLLTLWFIRQVAAIWTAEMTVSLVKNATYNASAQRTAGTVVHSERRTITSGGANSAVGQIPINLAHRLDLVENDRLTIEVEVHSGGSAYTANPGPGSQPSFWELKIRGID